MLIQQNMGAIYDGSQRLIAPVLNSTTATKNWEVDEEFILDGNLYKVTTAIPSGSQIIVSGSSANCELADTVTEQIKDVLDYLEVKTITFTKKQLLNSNVTLKLTEHIINISMFWTSTSATGTCTVPYGNMYYVPLATASDSDVITSFPKLANATVGRNVTLGAVLCVTSSNPIVIGSPAIYMQKTSATEWTIISTNFRDSTSGATKTVNAQYLWDSTISLEPSSIL